MLQCFLLVYFFNHILTSVGQGENLRQGAHACLQALSFCVVFIHCMLLTARCWPETEKQSILKLYLAYVCV